MKRFYITEQQLAVLYQNLIDIRKAQSQEKQLVSHIEIKKLLKGVTTNQELIGN